IASSSQAARTGRWSSSTKGPTASSRGCSWNPTCSPCPTRGRSCGPGTNRDCSMSSKTEEATSSTSGTLTWVTSPRSQGSGTPWALCTRPPLTRPCRYTCTTTC
uniref:Uncharacterized protein n=1 Tax=Gopherus agassizii TaxID=38772 RepID=A0A452J7P9_9SAUR